MVMSVTLPRPLAESGRLQAWAFPRVHVLSLPKANGDRVNVGWGVTNTSQITRFVDFGMTLGSMPTTHLPPGGVLAGASVSLAHSQDVFGQPDDVEIFGVIFLQELDSLGSIIRLIDSHNFSIRTPPAAPTGGLVSNGVPTIS